MSGEKSKLTRINVCERTYFFLFGNCWSKQLNLFKLDELNTVDPTVK